MKNTMLFFGALMLLISACKQDPKGSGQQSESKIDTRTLLAGHWIALDFCSRANQYGSVLDAMTNSHVPYAYAISFDPNKPDSAICNNGIEQWALPVKITDDTIEMIGARPGKSVYLVFHSQGKKDITMFDGTSGTVQMDNYIKSKANARDGYSAFSVALNHNLFDGSFKQLKKGNAAQNIQFTPGGFIMNWDVFDRYEVCTAGDCFVMGNDMDVITMSKSKEKDSGKMFGFKYSAQNDTLTIYNLTEINPQEKGTAKPKGIAFQFLRNSAGK